MAISVDYQTGIISIPQADLTPVGGSRYEFDVLSLHFTLRTLGASQLGGPHTRTHNHDTDATISGLLYAHRIIILAPYTIQFEDLQYEVRLFGANHNITDRKVLNQVSVITENSAGLIGVDGLSKGSAR